MTKQRIIEFAHEFTNHLFDESLLITHQDKLDAESKLQMWLTKEFAGADGKKVKQRLDQIHDGEWIEPMPNYILACCKCGLTHRMEFRVNKGKVQFRGWRIKGKTLYGRTNKN